jgi:catechol 2,3-dioxygenase-like lactoylglutathione lyase family enzyme
MTAPLRSVAAVRIFVSELERARAFYRDAIGLSESASGPDYAVFPLGPTTIVLEAVAHGEPEHDELVGRLLGVSFDVADMEQARRELASRGVGFLGPSEKQEWGGTLAFACDPDGNILTLVQFPA